MYQVDKKKTQTTSQTMTFANLDKQYLSLHDLHSDEPLS